jgi:hypothetical protein
MAAFMLHIFVAATIWTSYEPAYAQMRQNQGREPSNYVEIQSTVSSGSSNLSKEEQFLLHSLTLKLMQGECKQSPMVKIPDANASLFDWRVRFRRMDMALQHIYSELKYTKNPKPVTLQQLRTIDCTELALHQFMLQVAQKATKKAACFPQVQKQIGNPVTGQARWHVALKEDLSECQNTYQAITETAKLAMTKTMQTMFVLQQWLEFKDPARDQALIEKQQMLFKQYNSLVQQIELYQGLYFDPQALHEIFAQQSHKHPTRAFFSQTLAAFATKQKQDRKAYIDSWLEEQSGDQQAASETIQQTPLPSWDVKRNYAQNTQSQDVSDKNDVRHGLGITRQAMQYGAFSIWELAQWMYGKNYFHGWQQEVEDAKLSADQIQKRKDEGTQYFYRGYKSETEVATRAICSRRSSDWQKECLYARVHPNLEHSKSMQTFLAETFRQYQEAQNTTEGSPSKQAAWMSSDTNKRSNPSLHYQPYLERFNQKLRSFNQTCQDVHTLIEADRAEYEKNPKTQTFREEGEQVLPYSYNPHEVKKNLEAQTKQRFADQHNDLMFSDALSFLFKDDPLRQAVGFDTHSRMLEKCARSGKSLALLANIDQILAAEDRIAANQMEGFQRAYHLHTQFKQGQPADFEAFVKDTMKYQPLALFNYLVENPSHEYAKNIAAYMDEVIASQKFDAIKMMFKMMGVLTLAVIGSVPSGGTSVVGGVTVTSSMLATFMLTAVVAFGIVSFPFDLESMQKQIIRTRQAMVMNTHWNLSDLIHQQTQNHQHIRNRWIQLWVDAVMAPLLGLSLAKQFQTVQQQNALVRQAQTILSDSAGSSKQWESLYRRWSGRSNSGSSGGTSTPKAPAPTSGIPLSRAAAQKVQNAIPKSASPAPTLSPARANPTGPQNALQKQTSEVATLPKPQPAQSLEVKGLTLEEVLQPLSQPLTKAKPVLPPATPPSIGLMETANSGLSPMAVVLPHAFSAGHFVSDHLTAEQTRRLKFLQKELEKHHRNMQKALEAIQSMNGNVVDTQVLSLIRALAAGGNQQAIEWLRRFDGRSGVRQGIASTGFPSGYEDDVEASAIKLTLTQQKKIARWLQDTSKALSKKDFWLFYEWASVHSPFQKSLIQALGLVRTQNFYARIPEKNTDTFIAHFRRTFASALRDVPKQEIHQYLQALQQTIDAHRIQYWQQEQNQQAIVDYATLEQAFPLRTEDVQEIILHALTMTQQPGTEFFDERLTSDQMNIAVHDQKFLKTQEARAIADQLIEDVQSFRFAHLPIYFYYAQMDQETYAHARALRVLLGLKITPTGHMLYGYSGRNFHPSLTRYLYRTYPQIGWNEIKKLLRFVQNIQDIILIQAFQQNPDTLSEELSNYYLDFQKNYPNQYASMEEMVAESDLTAQTYFQHYRDYGIHHNWYPNIEQLQQRSQTYHFDLTQIFDFIENHASQIPVTRYIQPPYRSNQTSQPDRVPPMSSEKILNLETVIDENLPLTKKIVQDMNELLLYVQALGDEAGPALTRLTQQVRFRIYMGSHAVEQADLSYYPTDEHQGQENNLELLSQTFAKLQRSADPVAWQKRVAPLLEIYHVRPFWQWSEANAPYTPMGNRLQMHVWPRTSLQDSRATITVIRNGEPHVVSQININQAEIYFLQHPTTQALYFYIQLAGINQPGRVYELEFFPYISSLFTQHGLIGGQELDVQSQLRMLRVNDQNQIEQDERLAQHIAGVNDDEQTTTVSEGDYIETVLARQFPNPADLQRILTLTDAMANHSDLTHLESMLLLHATHQWGQHPDGQEADPEASAHEALYRLLQVGKLHGLNEAIVAPMIFRLMQEGVLFSAAAHQNHSVDEETALNEAPNQTTGQKQTELTVHNQENLNEAEKKLWQKFKNSQPTPEALLKLPLKDHGHTLTTKRWPLGEGEQDVYIKGNFFGSKNIATYRSTQLEWSVYEIQKDIVNRYPTSILVTLGGKPYMVSEAMPATQFQYVDSDGHTKGPFNSEKIKEAMEDDYDDLHYIEMDDWDRYGTSVWLNLDLPEALVLMDMLLGIVDRNLSRNMVVVGGNEVVNLTLQDLPYQLSENQQWMIFDGNLSFQENENNSLYDSIPETFLDWLQSYQHTTIDPQQVYNVTHYIQGMLLRNPEFVSALQQLTDEVIQNRFLLSEDHQAMLIENRNYLLSLSQQTPGTASSSNSSTHRDQPANPEGPDQSHAPTSSLATALQKVDVQALPKLHPSKEVRLFEDPSGQAWAVYPSFSNEPARHVYRQWMVMELNQWWGQPLNIPEHHLVRVDGQDHLLVAYQKEARFDATIGSIHLPEATIGQIYKELETILGHAHMAMGMGEDESQLAFFQNVSLMRSHGLFHRNFTPEQELFLLVFHILDHQETTHNKIFTHPQNTVTDLDLSHGPVDQPSYLTRHWIDFHLAFSEVNDGWTPQQLQLIQQQLSRQSDLMERLRVVRHNYDEFLERFMPPGLTTKMQAAVREDIDFAWAQIQTLVDVYYGRASIDALVSASNETEDSHGTTSAANSPAPMMVHNEKTLNEDEQKLWQAFQASTATHKAIQALEGDKSGSRYFVEPITLDDSKTKVFVKNRVPAMEWSMYELNKRLTQSYPTSILVTIEGQPYWVTEAIDFTPFQYTFANGKQSEVLSNESLFNRYVAEDSLPLLEEIEDSELMGNIEHYGFVQSSLPEVFLLMDLLTQTYDRALSSKTVLVGGQSLVELNRDNLPYVPEKGERWMSFDGGNAFDLNDHNYLFDNKPIDFTIFVEGYTYGSLDSDEIANVQNYIQRMLLRNPAFVSALGQLTDDYIYNHLQLAPYAQAMLIQNRDRMLELSARNHLPNLLAPIQQRDASSSASQHQAAMGSAFVIDLPAIVAEQKDLALAHAYFTQLADPTNTTEQAQVYRDTLAKFKALAQAQGKPWDHDAWVVTAYAVHMRGNGESPTQKAIKAAAIMALQMYWSHQLNLPPPYLPIDMQVHQWIQNLVDVRVLGQDDFSDSPQPRFSRAFNIQNSEMYDGYIEDMQTLQHEHPGIFALFERFLLRGKTQPNRTEFWQKVDFVTNPASYEIRNITYNAPKDLFSLITYLVQWPYAHQRALMDATTQLLESGEIHHFSEVMAHLQTFEPKALQTPESLQEASQQLFEFQPVHGFDLSDQMMMTGNQSRLRFQKPDTLAYQNEVYSREALMEAWSQWEIASLSYIQQPRLLTTKAFRVVDRPEQDLLQAYFQKSGRPSDMAFVRGMSLFRPMEEFTDVAKDPMAQLEIIESDMLIPVRLWVQGQEVIRWVALPGSYQVQHINIDERDGIAHVYTTSIFNQKTYRDQLEQWHFDTEYNPFRLPWVARTKQDQIFSEPVPEQPQRPVQTIEKEDMVKVYPLVGQVDEDGFTAFVGRYLVGHARAQEEKQFRAFAMALAPSMKEDKNYLQLLRWVYATTFDPSVLNKRDYIQMLYTFFQEVAGVQQPDVQLLEEMYNAWVYHFASTSNPPSGQVALLPQGPNRFYTDVLQPRLAESDFEKVFHDMIHRADMPVTPENQEKMLTMLMEEISKFALNAQVAKAKVHDALVTILTRVEHHFITGHLNVVDHLYITQWALDALAATVTFVDDWQPIQALDHPRFNELTMILSEVQVTPEMLDDFLETFNQSPLAQDLWKIYSRLYQNHKKTNHEPHSLDKRKHQLTHFLYTLRLKQNSMLNVEDATEWVSMFLIGVQHFTSMDPVLFYEFSHLLEDIAEGWSEMETGERPDGSGDFLAQELALENAMMDETMTLVNQTDFQQEKTITHAIESMGMHLPEDKRDKIVYETIQAFLYQDLIHIQPGIERLQEAVLLAEAEYVTSQADLLHLMETIAQLETIQQQVQAVQRWIETFGDTAYTLPTQKQNMQAMGQAMNYPEVDEEEWARISKRWSMPWADPSKGILITQASDGFNYTQTEHYGLGPQYMTRDKTYHLTPTFVRKDFEGWLYILATDTSGDAYLVKVPNPLMTLSQVSRQLPFLQPGAEDKNKQQRWQTLIDQVEQETGQASEQWLEDVVQRLGQIALLQSQYYYHAQRSPNEVHPTISFHDAESSLREFAKQRFPLHPKIEAALVEAAIDLDLLADKQPLVDELHKVWTRYIETKMMATFPVTGAMWRMTQIELKKSLAQLPMQQLQHLKDIWTEIHRNPPLYQNLNVQALWAFVMDLAWGPMAQTLLTELKPSWAKSPSMTINFYTIEPVMDRWMHIIEYGHFSIKAADDPLISYVALHDFIENRTAPFITNYRYDFKDDPEAIKHSQARYVWLKLQEWAQQRLLPHRYNHETGILEIFKTSMEEHDPEQPGPYMAYDFSSIRQWDDMLFIQVLDSDQPDRLLWYTVFVYDMDFYQHYDFDDSAMMDEFYVAAPPLSDPSTMEGFEFPYNDDYNEMMQDAISPSVTSDPYFTLPSQEVPGLQHTIEAFYNHDQASLLKPNAIRDGRRPVLSQTLLQNQINIYDIETLEDMQLADLDDADETGDKRMKAEAARVVQWIHHNAKQNLPPQELYCLQNRMQVSSNSQAIPHWDDTLFECYDSINHPVLVNRLTNNPSFELIKVFTNQTVFVPYRSHTVREDKDYTPPPYNGVWLAMPVRSQWQRVREDGVSQDGKVRILILQDADVK